MNLRQVLQENGFSEKAAKVYLALLAIKEGTVSDIAKRARIKRPTAYLVLAELESQGLVSHVKRGGSLHYRALNPFSLLERQHDRFHSLREAMPELVAMSAVSDPRPQMSVFEGEKGLREIMEDTLTAKGEILYWADMTIITTTVFKDYWRLYVKKRVAKRISTGASSAPMKLQPHSSVVAPRSFARPTLCQKNAFHLPTRLTFTTTRSPSSRIWI